MKKIVGNSIILFFLSFSFVACEKENQEIDSSFRVNSISVEYPGSVINDLTSNDNISVDTSGVLTYSLTVATLQDLKQVSVFHTYWSTNISDSRFTQSYGECFAYNDFDGDTSITFDIVIDLSDNTNPSVSRSAYPNHNSITVQAFVENELDNGTAFIYTIKADSMLAK